MKRFLISAALLLAAPAIAHEFTVGNLAIGHPYAFETAPMAKAGAGYLSITNNGDSADVLVNVSADVGNARLHESVQKDGIASMHHVERLEIPAGATVELAPGGYHVMFMSLDGEQFEVGEHIPATLTFENAGEVTVEFVVEPRVETAPNKGHMNHGG